MIPSTLRMRVAPLLGVLGLLSAAPAAAQEVPPACPAGRISTIFVDNHSVFDLSDPDLSARFGWAYRLANRLHVPTREEVVRREILFRPGDCYDVEVLRDSERLLREFSFIADVDIFGVRQPDGTIHVIVDTMDEWSTRVDVRAGAGGVLGLEGVRLREDNLLGTGTQVSAFFLNDEEEQVYGVGYYTPQILDSRWDAQLEVGRTPVGYRVTEVVSYPFVGQLGRWAFRQAVQHEDRYFEFFMPSGDSLLPVWYPERRQAVTLGGALRWGESRYRQTMVGAGLTGEWVSYPGEARYGRRVAADATAALPAIPALSLDSVSSMRVMLLTGQRNVYYARQRALDTVNGTEDVRLGVETEIALGPSLPALSTDHDLALNFGLFAAGLLPGGTLAGADLVMEARRNYETAPGTSEWSDVLGQMDAWAYWRRSPDSRHLLVAALSAVGGWHDRTPFQLTLGSDAGLRGYPDHIDPGGQRVILSLEGRSYLGWPQPSLFDLGTVVFVDAGKIWAGDAPFGVTSPLRVGAGVGLRAAFPRGSRQTFRLDFGYPVHGGAARRGLQILFGMGQVIGTRAVEGDPQLSRSSRRRLSPSLVLFRG